MGLEILILDDDGRIRIDYQFVSGVREQAAPALAGIESMFQEGLHPRVRQHWKPFRCSQCQPIPGGSMPSKHIDRLNGIDAKRLAGAMVLRHGSVAAWVCSLG